jgi:Kef-type K+ transport system membrane component KefB
MRTPRWSSLLLFAAWPALASTPHADPSAPVVLALAIILVAAKLGGHLAVRLGQPSVLGELVAGVLLGNAPLVGVHAFEPLEHDLFVDMFARVGVIILLFEVGLESTVAQMLKVGVSALLVAVIGVAVPFAAGWAVATWLLPQHSLFVHLFIGATLTATSVGITARVLKDLGRSQEPSARVILGAAVIDDVLGLVILAVVTGLVTAADAGTRVSALDVAGILGKAVLFLVGALTVGMWLSPRLFKAASRLRAGGVLLSVSLVLCFALAALSDAIGLAPIVGAFAAGLILEDTHYRALAEAEHHSLEELVHPLASFLVPVFFVQMGLKTQLAAFLAPGVLSLAFALCVVAIVGKVVAGLGALGPGVDRLSVGLGMVPRGEVGLIFAGIGAHLTVKGEQVMDEQTFSAIVLMVIVTTVVTAPALSWSLGRQRRGQRTT